MRVFPRLYSPECVEDDFCEARTSLGSTLEFRGLREERPGASWLVVSLCPSKGGVEGNERDGRATPE